MIEVPAQMFHPKRTLQTLNLPFNRKLSSQLEGTLIKSLPVIYFLAVFLLLILVSANAEAQPHPEKGDFHLPAKAMADFYFSQGKFKEAMEIYKSVLADETKPGYIFRNMVKAWKAMGALDEAGKFLNEYRRSHEKSSAVWYALGYLHYIKNEDQKAEELFKRATELDPENGLAWNNWAAVLVNGKRFQEALEKVRTAILANPKELMFFFNLKKIFEEMGEGQKFEEEYKESIKAGTGSWGYGKALARSLRQSAFSDYDKGDLVGAIAGFEKILNIYRQISDVNGQVPALFSLGLLHEESGNIPRSQEYFEQVLSINPGHIQAREKVSPQN
ncbi:MAG: tetratricopeptide repeat protein [Nitrospinae bacterium]|nr:tetratricopeptide repeat protein [Nitrospinota bacterium]MBL7019844.1 tetratricopeptide repeat protein [Nitrospinaceae bacterium]